MNIVLVSGTMAPKARQGKDKATTSQKGKKRGRKEQGESSSMQVPRRMFGIKWVLEEEAKEWYRNNKEKKYVHVDLINKESLAKKEPRMLAKIMRYILISSSKTWENAISI